MDCGKRQTPTVTPAKPGDYPFYLRIRWLRPTIAVPGAAELAEELRIAGHSPGGKSVDAASSVRASKLAIRLRSVVSVLSSACMKWTPKLGPAVKV